MNIKMKIKTGDIVIVTNGKDKGKTGEILKVFPSEGKLIVAGVNVFKKHQKPSKTSAGGIVSKEAKINVSNVAYCDNGKPSKVGFKFNDEGVKVRYAKKSGNIILDKKFAKKNS